MLPVLCSSDLNTFFTIKRELLLKVTLGSAMSHLRPRFDYTLCNYGPACIQGVRQPAVVKNFLSIPYKHVDLPSEQSISEIDAKV